MSLLDRLKNVFNSIFKKKDENLLLAEKNPSSNVTMPQENNQPIIQSEPEEEIDISFEEGTIVKNSEEVLDTNSKVSQEMLKHNLQVLINQAKEQGKVDKFMLIREDNFFPNDWEWRLLSKNTNVEPVATPLSYKLRNAIAFEKNGIDISSKKFGMRIPTKTTPDDSVWQTIDKDLGKVLLPSRFRSTVHFTVNTPLEVTGDYNAVKTERDFIVIDNMDNFLNSGYGYSVSYRDAYLDISHENLPISEEAVVLIDDSKYEKIISDPKIAEQLTQRKVIRYKGETEVAIDMVLAEMGVLPSKVGSKFAMYDDETKGILDKSIQNLAKKHDLLFEKSHGGLNGHFSSHFDAMNEDYQLAEKEFMEFLCKKFPNHADLLKSQSYDVVDEIGSSQLLDAINEYNELAKARIAESVEKRKEDRKTITPKIHSQFVGVVSLINNYYKTPENYSSYEERQKVESVIQNFFQSETVEEQLQSAKGVWELLRAKEQNKQQTQNSIIKDKDDDYR